MHTLPLPKVTDDKQEAKGETGSLKLGWLQRVPRDSSFDLRDSANSPHLTRPQPSLRVFHPASPHPSLFRGPAGITRAHARQARVLSGLLSVRQRDARARLSPFLVCLPRPHCGTHSPLDLLTSGNVRTRAPTRRACCGRVRA